MNAMPTITLKDIEGMLIRVGRIEEQLTSIQTWKSKQDDRYYGIVGRMANTRLVSNQFWTRLITFAGYFLLIRIVQRVIFFIYYVAVTPPDHMGNQSLLVSFLLTIWSGLIY